ncbi:MAG: transporter substrate-binding domain-containing protein [Bacteroidota bacterium]
METPGFASSNDQGEVEGLCMDLLEDFVSYCRDREGINLSVDYQGANPNDFNRFLSEVKTGSGGVIGLGNITITSARRQEYTFTPAFINNLTIIVTNKSVPTLRNLEDIQQQFAGMKAYAVAGSTNAANLEAIKQRYWPNLEIVTLPSSPEVLEAVISDGKSFTNLDLAYFLSATRAGKPIKRHPAGDERSEEFGLLMPKGTDWAPVWNRFLTTEYRNSTGYKQKIAEHLGATALKLLTTVGG